MPTPDELKAMMENLDQMRLGPDDTFRFKCYGCGKCCKNRDDILLNSFDLYRLAKHLKLNLDHTVERYGETYIGGQSCIPIVRLKPVGKSKVCPLLKDNRCSVHAFKPTVCALYPLGRYLKASSVDSTAPPETGYFVQSVPCGGYKQNTVRSYLESFGIPIEDEFFAKWSASLMFLSSFCSEALRKGAGQKEMNVVWGIIFDIVYLRYSVESEFLPQFDANLAQLRSWLVPIMKNAPH